MATMFFSDSSLSIDSIGVDMKLALGPIHPSMALESNGKMLELANPFLMLLSKKAFLNNKEILLTRISLSTTCPL